MYVTFCINFTSSYCNVLLLEYIISSLRVENMLYTYFLKKSSTCYYSNNC